MLTDDPADFITVDQLKDHLKKAGTTADDGELAYAVSSACAMVRERIGEVSQVGAVSEASFRRGLIVLEHRPVVSITSVQQLPGLAEVPEADSAAGTAGWTLTGKGSGILACSSRLTGPVRVTYVAGRDPIPGDVAMAAKELAAHLWRGPKLNAGGTRPALTGDVASPAGSTYALPIRVRELLGLGSRTPRQEVLLG